MFGRQTQWAGVVRAHDNHMCWPEVSAITAELAGRLLGAASGLAGSPPAGSVGQWITDDVHVVCFALGAAGGSGWLGSRPASAPAYSRANLRRTRGATH